MHLQRIFFALGFVGVALGAFGAHALRSKVTADDLEIWKTATLYLFVHTLMGLLAIQLNNVRAAAMFLLGVTLFSGSLYTLVLSQVRILGAVTPLGGVSFLLGWLMLFLKSST